MTDPDHDDVSHSSPSKIGLVIYGAYLCLLRLIQNVPILLLVALIIVLASEFIKLAFPLQDLADRISRMTVDALATLLFAPVEFAFYRLLILDEKPSRDHFRFASLRFRRFLVWTVLFWLVAAWIDLLPPSEDWVTLPLFFFVFIPTLACTAFVFVRFVLLLPAIAAGAENATVRDAARDTKGHISLIVVVLSICLIPVLISVVAAIFVTELDMLSDMAGLSVWQATPQNLVDGFAEAMTKIILIATAAQLYLSIGDRIKLDNAKAT